MRTLLLIAQSEYLDRIRRRSFLLATGGVALILILVGVFGLWASGSRVSGAVGYVDRAGLLKPDALAQAAEGLEFRSYDDEAAALADLEAGRIQALYFIAADYLLSGRMTLLYWDKKPSNRIQAAFTEALRASLLADAPPSVRRRLLDGFHVVMRASEGEREASEEDILNFILPFVVGGFFTFVVMMASGYLLQAVTTEKENRMVEVLFTSVSAFQFIGGKALGLIAVAFTQLGVWLAILAALVFVFLRFTDFLAGVRPSWDFFALLLLYFIPTYALLSAIMIILGSVMADLQQSQQIAGMVNLLFVLPFFFTVLLFTDPNSPILVALTLFPTTAFITVAMRWGVTDIPAWQLVAAWFSVSGAALLGIYLAARVFRAGMLHYGRNVSFARLLKAGR
ncbi:MAG: ABC transporter permease [Chloroflexi bacterium]|nr:ABC transporter permease [Chloroflexota bacterium]